MRPPLHSLLLGLLVLSLGGCPKKKPAQDPLTGPRPSEPHHGAWYGSGMAFPGERLCIVFCPDGRMFAGDAKCGDVFYEKFATVWRYALADGVVTAETAENTITFQWSQTGTHAVANIASIRNLPMDQQTRRSPLCGNAPMPDAPATPAPAIPF